MTVRTVDARGDSEFDRGLSFFDAVYGFAATLLIANVDPPPPEQWRDLGELAGSELALQLFGVALSFTVIATMWRANVQAMRRLRGLDGPTIALNLLAAGLVVLLPFTTQGISDQETTLLALPTAVYAVNVACAAFAQVLLFQVGRARGLERVPTSRRQNFPVLIDELMTPVVFFASVPVALLFNGTAAKYCWLALVAIGPVSGRWAARAVARTGSGQASA